MAGKTPRPACVEEYDEIAGAILPDSRQVANTAAKVTSRLDLRFPAEPPLIDGASDSGYSSRTAATGNSTQSGPSGRKSPPGPLKLDMPKRNADLSRKGSYRRDRKDKERDRPVHEERMVGAYTASARHQTHVHRSPSKSHRRETSHNNYPDAYYEGNAYYPSPTPIEPPRPMDFPSQYAFRPPVPDYPPSSPQYAPRYHAAVIEQYHSSRPSGRPSRSNSYYHHPGYHSERPMSWAMGSPHPSYDHSLYGYEPHGPPPSSSAYSNVPYSSSPYGGASYCPPSEYGPPLDYPRERSVSRPRDPSRHRRGSVYEAPLEPEMFAFYEEGEPLDRWYSHEQPRESRDSREARGRRPVKPSRDYEEDARQEEARRRMPPPPPPAMKPPRTAPQVHQTKRPEARKSQTTTAVPSQRRSSRAMDMSDVRAALPDYGPRRVSREARLPERSSSHRDRSNSYHDSGRGAQVAVESSHRRRAPQEYYYEEPGRIGDLEDRAADIERYQAVQAGRSTTTAPLSEEALLPKIANGTGSETGSQKSRSNSSRGSGNGSKTETENKNMTLMMNGMTIGFTEESVMGKNISIRTGGSGGVHLNIADGTAANRPKNYLTGGSSYSDYTRGSNRQIEDVQRAHSDRRSERASRRSSRSSYGASKSYRV